MSFGTNLPDFCSGTENFTHWVCTFPHIQMATLQFDETKLNDRDFLNADIDLPASLTYAVRKRKAEYLAGRLCAREALRRATGIDVAPKTSGDRAPLWPAGCVGSITHSNGTAVAAGGSTKHYASIGLDMESIMSNEQALALTKQILTCSERQRFQHVIASAPGEFLTLVFSLKESLYKALYPLTLKFFYFEDAELLCWQHDGRAKLRLLTDLSACWRRYREVDAHFVMQQGTITSLILIPKT